jgi:hypothetical protein
MGTGLVRLIPMMLLAAALPVAAPASAGQPQPAPQEAGIHGYVLAPDGTPVADGRVAMQSVTHGASAAIDSAGRFRIVPPSAGAHQLFVTVAGFAPYRVEVTVPASRMLRLPPIRLLHATYFRARFVTAAGEPITAPLLRRQSVDITGLVSGGPAVSRETADGEGTVTIGPLPRGVTTLGLDTLPMAQTRLSDLYVTGAETLLDAGTVIVQPGAVLHVDVVDGNGVAVASHNVFLEDVAPFSPFGGRPERTNQAGRATFERLGAGRYRVRTSAARPCGSQHLALGRLVSVAGNGALRTRIVAGGSASFRVTSPFGPLSGVRVVATPETFPTAVPAWVRASNEPGPFRFPLRPFASETACAGATDADGRVTLASFPPGPARVDVRQQHSTYVRRVSIPQSVGEVVLAIPDGVLPVRVSNAMTHQPVPSAAVTWTGGGARIEATASAAGEALLEGVGSAPGTLAISARGYLDHELKMAEPSAMLREVALTAAPPSAVHLVVASSTGEPLANAVVEMAPDHPLDVGRVAAADAEGRIVFPDAPPGSLRLIASADGFIPAMLPVRDEQRSGVVMRLSRGYRAVARVELPAAAGVHRVRVVDETGASVDALLDAASDRSVQPPARLSLGPLPPGAYVIELHGTGGVRTQPIRIIDRDADVVIR